MSESIGLSFLDSRKESWDIPHAVFQGGGWTWKILKTWQPGNEGKKHARWMCAVSSPFLPAGMEDYGDVYVADIAHALAVLVEVGGKIPTREQEQEWADLAAHLVLVGVSR